MNWRIIRVLIIAAALTSMFALRSTAEDGSESTERYKKLAEAGDLEAMATLGNMYASGQGLAKDYQSAVHWLTPAAAAGLARAQHDLGALYYYGNGVPRDHAVAAKWFHAAAEQGFVASQAVLGEMYCQADPPDYEKALQWLNKAADKGNTQALNRLGQLYRNGLGVPKDERKAFDCQRKAAEAGDRVAGYNIGVFYAEGTFVPRDYTEAIRWLRPAAEDAVLDPTTKAQAQFLIGAIYQLGGDGIDRNSDEAMSWYEKAAHGGHVDAQRLFGQMLRDQKRYAEAVPWLRMAAEKGDRASQNDLGTMYAMGWGVPQSRKDAIAWLLRAYQQGSPTARESLRKLGIDAK
jgi:uncharacterized protein